nr:ParB/RepB/Spo0J family partition protein [Providencia sp. PROV216]
MTLNQLIDAIDLYFSDEHCDNEKIQALNQLKICLHKHSPFNKEPVDCVIWVKSDIVAANDYNPNVMAPAEKRLLKYSIEKDGFTQPIVVCQQKEKYLVIDGFHRHLLGKTQANIRKRLQGFLPVTCVHINNKEKAGQIATTIRHNRARGKHLIASMSDIVRDLSHLGWNNSQISLELGMDEDEVLRLKQISGITELFCDAEYSLAWTVK